MDENCAFIIYYYLHENKVFIYVKAHNKTNKQIISSLQFHCKLIHNIEAQSLTDTGKQC